MRFLVYLLLLTAQVLSAQGADFIRSHYTKSELLIPMRDGKRLFTVVYQPQEAVADTHFSSSAPRTGVLP